MNKILRKKDSGFGDDQFPGGDHQPLQQPGGHSYLLPALLRQDVSLDQQDKEKKLWESGYLVLRSVNKKLKVPSKNACKTSRNYNCDKVES